MLSESEKFSSDSENLLIWGMQFVVGSESQSDNSQVYRAILGANIEQKARESSR